MAGLVFCEFRLFLQYRDGQVGEALGKLVCGGQADNAAADDCDV